MTRSPTQALPSSRPAFLRRFLRLAAVAGLGLSCGSFPLAATPETALTFPDPDKGPGAGWTMVVFPDTQNYVKYAKNNALLESMTKWVVDHREAWNIQLALHCGDLVEQNDIAEGGGQGFGDQSSAQQWESERRAFSVLRAKVPVIFTLGNHDYGIRRADDRRTRFNDVFKLTDDPLLHDGKGGGIWVESAPNASGVKTLENAAYVFEPPFGRKLLVLSLEWGPRQAVVDWAKEVAARPAYREHVGIILTHAFLLDTDQRDTDDKASGNPHTYPTGKAGDTHDGEELWQELIQPASQIEMVINGHYTGDHYGYRKDPNASGRPVHQIFFNAQDLGGGSDEKGNGGDGWFRLYTFEPDQRTVTIRTFSPLFLSQGKDPWARGPGQSFMLQLAPPP